MVFISVLFDNIFHARNLVAAVYLHDHVLELYSLFQKRFDSNSYSPIIYWFLQVWGETDCFISYQFPDVPKTGDAHNQVASEEQNGKEF